MYFNNTEKVPPHDKNLVQRQRQHVKSGGGSAFMKWGVITLILNTSGIGY